MWIYCLVWVVLEVMSLSVEWFVMVNKGVELYLVGYDSCVGLVDFEIR